MISGVMNAKSHKFDINVDESSCEELLSALMHTLFFHRSTGRFRYSGENNYSIGSVGFIDVDCKVLDLTYVKSDCAELHAKLHREIVNFHQQLMKPVNRDSGGQLHLEFFEKRRPRWPLRMEENIPWEIWTFQLKMVDFYDKEQFLQQLSSTIIEKILLISEAITSTEYVPKIPVLSDLNLIFDTSFTNLQPYLHRIYSTFNDETSKPVRQVMSRMFSDTYFPV
ncbi:autophagy-related protein 101-like [Symsagittifera roscoffensis]|uniref:autophagy-related protein 101-like n=1 Tax=Symsagittifera roscoffensis TaxID=84072 RepID=UPI00307CA8FD